MPIAVPVALVNGEQTRAKASPTHHQKERQNRGVLSSATVDHSGPFTQLLSDRLVLYKAFAPVFLQSCVPVYVRVHTGVGGDVGNHVHSQYLLRLFLSPRSPAPLLLSGCSRSRSRSGAVGSTRSGRRKGARAEGAVGSDRSTGSADKSSAGERSRKQLAEAKARDGALEWSMQLQASAARAG